MNIPLVSPLVIESVKASQKQLIEIDYWVPKDSPLWSQFVIEGNVVDAGPVDYSPSGSCTATTHRVDYRLPLWLSCWLFRRLFCCLMLSQRFLSPNNPIAWMSNNKLELCASRSKWLQNGWGYLRMVADACGQRKADGFLNSLNAFEYLPNAFRMPSDAF